MYVSYQTNWACTCKQDVVVMKTRPPCSYDLMHCYLTMTKYHIPHIPGFLFFMVEQSCQLYLIYVHFIYLYIHTCSLYNYVLPVVMNSNIV